MILNISRANQFQECRQKAWNWHELGLMAHREADALMTGEAFHAGIANLFATRNIAQSEALAETTYRKRLEGQLILTEEQQLVEQQIELSKRAVRKYAEHYTNEPFQVLMPEVKFFVELPNTHHHCWFAHRLLQKHQVIHTINGSTPFNYNIPYTQCNGYHPDDNGVLLQCRQPHYLMGRTDAVINWNNLIWLLEHKTTAQTGQIFYDRFFIDHQTTGYLYGIWKATGLKPHGFLLNVIKKPQKRAGADPFAISFEREPYIREQADLDDFEQDIIRIANNYEQAFATQDIYKNPKSCTSYNRKCYYFDLCKRHNQIEEGEFHHRNPDYIDLEYYTLLNLPKPQIEEMKGDVVVDT